MEVIFIILGIILILALIYILMIYPGKPRKIDSFLLKPYAHRGLWNDEWPENSISAFKNAVTNGFGIELDIQLSKDKEVMVFHDYSLERMTGNPAKLCDLTCEELQNLRLKGTGESIPTLSEVLSIVDGSVPLLVELKGENGNTELCKTSNEILSRYNGKYCIESFNPLLVAWYRKNRPEIVRGQLVTVLCMERKRSVLNMLLDNMLLNFLTRPDFAAFDIKFQSNIPVTITTKIFKAQRFVWTIHTPEEAQAAKSADAYPIFETNAAEAVKNNYKGN